MSPIETACEILGSQKALADGLSITPGAVSQWISGERPIPALRCPAIERLTNRKVTCEQLRPDVDWAYLRSPQEAIAGDTGPAPETLQRQAA